jgi:two-component system, chemotaxis family, CheB/CheR fusion protein
MAKRPTKETDAPAPAAAAEIVSERGPVPFPIAGIGASAGGLRPFLELLRNLPEEPGLAIVFVLHQHKHDSVLDEIVGRGTTLPVVKVEDGITVQANHIYIAPPAQVVSIEGGRLFVRATEKGEQRPIDAFFHSLAEDQTNCALGVVLSGADSDGAAGTLAIRAEGGINFAQDESAEFPQMPHAAIAAGAVDFVLSAEGIAAELANVARYTRAAPMKQRLPERDLAAVFKLLHASHNIDFTHYKPATIERRIRRRMALHKLESLGDYVALLAGSRSEIEQLCNDILIRVTGFFRDPDVFDTLSRTVVPLLVANRSVENPLRVWVAGCATGEEVYSLAMVLLEATEQLGAACPVQIFGTDISDTALERARIGLYHESIAADVSPERLRRHFTRTENGYRVSKALRDCCIFARQNLAKDPPFSRIDLVSCRNVLIYLDQVLQRKVMSIFHYALRPNGYLLLGSSETIGSFGDLFTAVDRKHKIYMAKVAANRLTVDFQSPPPPVREQLERPRAIEPTQGQVNIFREADKVMLSRLAPAGVLINDSGDILQFRGRTSSYLEPPPGVASFDILKMAREGLLADLRAAIHAARKSDVPVRREGIRVKTNGHYSMVDVEVIPFTTAQRQRFAIVLFQEQQEPAVPVSAKPKRGRRASAADEENSRAVTRLERELEATRDYLQSIIEEQEAMNEELRSANEEIHSSNEELQSANEELETAKEELQSSNEELTTLNEELAMRNVELAEANNDLINLLASIDVAIVMLDSELRIRRFNPGAQRILGLIPGDVGRPMRDLKTSLAVDDLETMIAGVIDDLKVRELEVQDRRGGTHLLRIRPYKTTENRIDGAVLALVDIEHLKKK